MKIFYHRIIIIRNITFPRLQYMYVHCIVSYILHVKEVAEGLTVTLILFGELTSTVTLIIAGGLTPAILTATTDTVKL